MKIRKSLKEKKAIFFGETHGIRENLEILQKVIDENKDILQTLILEFPIEHESELNNYILGRKRSINWLKWNFKISADGRLSKEFFQFLHWLREVNMKQKNKIMIACVDIFGEKHINSKPNQRDKWMGENIRKEMNKLKKDKKAVGILGEFHARKEVFDKKRIPALYQLRNDKVVSIRLIYRSGTCFNIGLREVKKSRIKKEGIIKTRAKGFDYALVVKKASPITPLGKFNSKDLIIEV